MIYSKKKWEQVNKYNKNLLNDFILEMRSNKKKEGTINIYVSSIRIVLIYIQFFNSHGRSSRNRATAPQAPGARRRKAASSQPPGDKLNITMSV